MKRRAAMDIIEPRPTKRISDVESYSTNDLKAIVGQEGYLKLICDEGLTGVEMNGRGEMRYFGGEINAIFRKRPRVKPSKRANKNAGVKERPAQVVEDRDPRVAILAARFLE